MKAEPRTPGDSAVGDAPMRAAIRAVAGCGVLFSVLAFAFADARMGVGVLIGGAIATVNLIVFARVGQAFIARKGNTTPWGVVAVLKLVLLFGGVGLILKSGFVSGLSLAIGYAALPFGVTFASLFGPKPVDDEGLTRTSGREAGHALPPPKPPGDDELPSTESSRRSQDVIKRPRHGSDDEGSEP